jgi:hypothetical protein
MTVFVVLPIYPGGASADLLGIHVNTALVDPRHCSAIAISVLDHKPDLLAEDKARKRLLGLVPVRLCGFGRVYLGQAHFDLLFVGGETSQGVTS